MSRRPRSGARHTVSSANGASLNQPANGKHPRARHGSAPQQHRHQQHRREHDVGCAGGHNDQERRERQPGQRGAQSGLLDLGRPRRTRPRAGAGGDPEHCPGGHHRCHGRDREPAVDGTPQIADRRDQRQRRVQHVAEDRIGVAVDDARRHVAVRQHAMDHLGRALHDGVDHVHGVKRAHAHHHEYEREHDEQRAKPTNAPRGIEPRSHHGEQRRRWRRLATSTERLAGASKQQVDQPGTGGEHARVHDSGAGTAAPRPAATGPPPRPGCVAGATGRPPPSPRTARTGRKHCRLVGDPVTVGNPHLPVVDRLRLGAARSTAPPSASIRSPASRT